VSRPRGGGRLLRPAVGILAALLFLSCGGGAEPGESSAGTQTGPAESEAAEGDPATLLYPGEERLRNVRKLTSGGENAEGYLSPDQRQLIFQSTRDDLECDQIFTMPLDGGPAQMVSTGIGKTTCGYFYYPEGDRILYSSTHLAGAGCPPRPDFSQGYVWPLDEYEIFSARPDGSDVRRLTDSPGYDAEATFSHDGGRIVFTSMRDGDLEIYTMNPDGSDVTRLTHTPGYDGGPFFSADGKKIVFRAHHPEEAADLASYQELLAQAKVRPSQLEIFVMDADGSNRRQVTSNGAANFAPFFHPDGKRIIFVSNMADPGGRNFDMFLVNEDGTGLEQITFGPTFDGFPYFSADGRRIVFASNRFNQERGETNLFVADWVD